MPVIWPFFCKTLVVYAQSLLTIVDPLNGSLDILTSTRDCSGLFLDLHHYVISSRSWSNDGNTHWIDCCFTTVSLRITASSSWHSHHVCCSSNKATFADNRNGPLIINSRNSIAGHCESLDSLASLVLHWFVCQVPDRIYSLNWALNVFQFSLHVELNSDLLTELIFERVSIISSRRTDFGSTHWIEIWTCFNSLFT